MVFRLPTQARVSYVTIPHVVRFSPSTLCNPHPDINIILGLPIIALSPSFFPRLYIVVRRRESFLIKFVAFNVEEGILNKNSLPRVCQ